MPPVQAVAIYTIFGKSKEQLQITDAKLLIFWYSRLMDKDISRKLVDCILKYSEVQLFMLFGSRARAEANETSDWDFGYVATREFDSTALYSDLILLLSTEKVDLVNLSRVNGLLRFRAARDGKVVFERTKGEYEKFWLQAVHFWCDAGPIIRAEYEALLRRIA